VKGERTVTEIREFDLTEMTLVAADELSHIEGGMDPAGPSAWQLLVWIVKSGGYWI
jgi:hypothetical protein